MFSINFFLIFIPILSVILISVNFIFAPYAPYKEKKTPFECGYHSFLLQNRTQFTISFFIFALLFLLFDLEIVLIYPFTVSSAVNAVYGLIIMIIFAIIVTVGFVYELGKNALKIESKQSISAEEKRAEMETKESSIIASSMTKGKVLINNNSTIHISTPLLLVKKTKNKLTFKRSFFISSPKFIDPSSIEQILEAYKHANDLILDLDPDTAKEYAISLLKQQNVEVKSLKPSIQALIEGNAQLKGSVIDMAQEKRVSPDSEGALTKGTLALPNKKVDDITTSMDATIKKQFDIQKTIEKVTKDIDDKMEVISKLEKQAPDSKTISKLSAKLAERIEFVKSVAAEESNNTDGKIMDRGVLKGEITQGNSPSPSPSPSSPSPSSSGYSSSQDSDSNAH